MRRILLFYMEDKKRGEKCVTSIQNRLSHYHFIFLSVRKGKKREEGKKWGEADAFSETFSFLLSFCAANHSATRAVIQQRP